jgi:hypothetical protein
MKEASTVPNTMQVDCEFISKQNLQNVKAVKVVKAYREYLFSTSTIFIMLQTVV